MTQAPNQLGKLLYEKDGYQIRHLYEDAVLIWDGGSIEVGDHYGDPTCALLSVEGRWCATGGDGVVICRFKDGLPTGAGPVAESRLDARRVWEGRRIEAMYFYSDDEIRVLTDPVSDDAGLYEIDVNTLAWRKL